MEEPEPQVTMPEMLSGDARGPQSLKEQLRAKRQEIADTRDILLPITGYTSVNLQGRHRLMDRPEVEAMSKRIMRETKDKGERNMRILLDQIINSTLGFWIQEGAGEPTPLVDEDGVTTVERWDQLAVYLGWEPAPGQANARAALMWVFGDNEFSVGQYGIKLNRWMGDVTVDIDGDFLGE